MSIAADPVPTVTSATPGALYDSGRGIYYLKPAMRGWLHMIWFAASLVSGTLLIARSDGAARIAAVSVYAGAVSGLFGVSALYHRGNWGAVWQQRLQRLDHVMIFMMISGTATPAYVIATHGSYRIACLSVLWTLTALVIVAHLAWMSAPERLVGAAFVVLGWSALLAIPAVWVHAGVTPALLMVIGGLLYTAGAISYNRRSPDPAPATFGYHEVFHAYVCVAATCHYVAIAVFLT